MFLRILALSCFLFGISAQAQTQKQIKKFGCLEVAGSEEWSLSIDLAKHEAGYFDNDTWLGVPLLKVEQPEGSLVYTFGGALTSGNEGDMMVITFNKTTMSVTIHFLDKRGLVTNFFRAERGCIQY